MRLSSHVLVNLLPPMSSEGTCHLRLGKLAYFSFLFVAIGWSTDVASEFVVTTHLSGNQLRRLDELVGLLDVRAIIDCGYRQLLELAFEFRLRPTEWPVVLVSSGMSL